MSSEQPRPGPEPEAEPPAELDITADGAHVYAVTVGESGPGDGSARHYRVSVPDSLLDELNLEPPDEPALVRTGLELMLQRPEGPMPAEFSLDEAESRYPGLLDQLRTMSGR